MTAIESQYLKFLIGYAGLGSHQGRHYYLLAQILHERIFYSNFANDMNRSEDGKNLRAFFASQYDDPDDILMQLDGPCTVLEMLIGLAKRMDFMFIGSGDRNQASHWFFVLIQNLGLYTYDDDMLLGDEEKHEEVDRILDILLERHYERDGRGGLFPLRNPYQDQTKVEIWYQANAWMMENTELPEDDL